MSNFDLALLWIASALATLGVVVGKVGMKIFGLGNDPPLEPEALALWRMRSRWLFYSELSALPAFATIGVVVTIYFRLPPVAAVGISMVLGALGFGFLIHAVQLQARRKLEMEP